MCSSASASPHVSEWTHSPGGSPTQFASATSNICTYTSPTSRRTHSSNTSIRKRPYCSAVIDRLVTSSPFCSYSGRSRHELHGTSPSVASATRSMIGMNWTNRAPHSSRRNRYTVTTVIAVDGVHGRQRVPLHPTGPEVLEAADHLLERPLAALVDPVGVVQLPRPVDRDPDQELVLPEERGPLLVQQRPVGLNRVDSPLARLQILLRQLDRAPEEPDPHHRRLAALPGDLSPRARSRAPRSAAARTPPTTRRPSGTASPDTASPSTGRSSTSNRGYTQHPSASPADGKRAARRA